VTDELQAPGWLHDLSAALDGTPVPPVLRPPAGQGRRSAILVLFGPGAPGTSRAKEHGDDPDLLIIQRRPGLRRHGGQPAFPGGAIEAADRSPVQAALREAAEEVGLDPAGVDVIGTAPELYISSSGFRVVPVLGWWRRPVAVRPADPAEVAAVARVPVSEFADPANRLVVRHPSGVSGPAFQVRGMLVWGFTAALVSTLLTLGGWERPWDTSRIENLPPEVLAAATPADTATAPRDHGTGPAAAGGNASAARGGDAPAARGGNGSVDAG
jgi:8-oxo-dGTP pyrophosphatase MutT (NUDIX family)